tara:strand:- start:98 stop:427 length:330 start_codon:yes stop_codon:yes gene_type:complete
VAENLVLVLDGVDFDVVKTFSPGHPFRPSMDAMRDHIVAGQPDQAVYEVKRLAHHAKAAGFDRVQWDALIAAWDRKLMAETPPQRFMAYRAALTRGRGMQLGPREREYG